MDEFNSLSFPDLPALEGSNRGIGESRFFKGFWIVRSSMSSDLFGGPDNDEQDFIERH
jgi:hypothetical protein